MTAAVSTRKELGSVVPVGQAHQGYGRWLVIALFLLPSLLLYSAFVFYPLFQAAYYALYDWNGLGPLVDYVGLDNFRQVLKDEFFRNALKHNLIILVLSMLVQLPVALGLALLLGGEIRGRAFFRTVFFLPYVLSEVVVGLIWTFLYQPEGGINDLFAAILPNYQYRAWLSERDIVLYAIFIVITWKFVGFHMILYVAGLQGIPTELGEAARLDGASDFRVARDITIPLLAPTIRLSVFLSAIGSLQFFDLVWVMTKGGPFGASETMATYMYQYSFQRFKLGYGSAVSLVIFALCFGFALLYLRFVMRRDFESVSN